MLGKRKAGVTKWGRSWIITSATLLSLSHELIVGAHIY